MNAASRKRYLSAVFLLAGLQSPITCETERWGLDGDPAAPVAIELDPTFGENGRRTFDVLEGGFLDSESLQGIGMLPDGRIVVIGRSTDTFFQADGVMAVLDPQGRLDPAFGDGGIVVETFAMDTNFRSLAVDERGRVLVGGSTSVSRYEPSLTMVARYLPDGSRDPSFGTDPELVGVTRVLLPCRKSLWDIAVQADGSIVGTGGASCDTVLTINATRFLEDGRLDDRFGVDGTALLSEGVSGEVEASSEGSEARGVLIGSTVGPTGFDGALDFAITRLDSAGNVDPTFGSGGMVVTNFGDDAPGRNESLSSLLSLPSGEILASGSIQWLPNFEQPWETSYDFLLARYTQDGVLDSSFGADGWVAVDMGEDNEYASAVLTRSNGNIVLVGESGGVDWEKVHSIVHLREDGALAPGRPRTTTSEEGAGIRMKAATFDGSGRLLVAGSIRYESGGSSHAVWRYVFRRLD